MYSTMNFKLRKKLKVSHKNFHIFINIVIDKPITKKDDMPVDDDANSLKNNLRSLFKNLKLTVNRFHLRFEDDYFS